MLNEEDFFEVFGTSLETVIDRSQRNGVAAVLLFYSSDTDKFFVASNAKDVNDLLTNFLDWNKNGQNSYHH